MTRHILKQIWTQRRRNGWIFGELLIVFVLCWYMVDYAFVMVHNRMIPNGYDITDTYQIMYGKNVNDSTRAEYDQFIDKVKRFPGVQYVFATSDWSISPFSGSYNGNQIQRDSTSTGYHVQLKRVGDNSYFDVFAIRSTISGQRARLILSDNYTIILNQNLAELMFGKENPVGQTVYFGDKKPYRVTDVIEDQKRFDYQQPGNTVFYPSLNHEVSSPEISIRTGSNFSLEQFKRDVTSDIKSYQDVQQEQEFTWGITKEVRLRNGIMVFFLLNIMLGVIGTFWFRNQTRRSEIGLRMALGSSNRQIQNQYIIEALAILTLAAIPAIVINSALLQADIIKTLGEEVTGNYITANKWLRFAITNGITYVLLAVIVALSAWIPVRQASKVHPVEALRDE